MLSGRKNVRASFQPTQREAPVPEWDVVVDLGVRGPLLWALGFGKGKQFDSSFCPYTIILEVLGASS